MKNILLSLLLLCTTFAVAAPNPDDFAITVHVTGSRHRPGAGAGLQYLDVIINGKKYELVGSGFVGVLTLGDYKAKLKKGSHWNNYDIDQAYEFLMPDGKTRNYELSSISE